MTSETQIISMKVIDWITYQNTENLTITEYKTLILTTNTAIYYANIRFLFATAQASILGIFNVYGNEMKPQPIIRSIGSTFFVYYSNLRDDLNSSKMALAVYDINDLHKNKMSLTNDDNNIPYTIIKGAYYDWYWKP